MSANGGNDSIFGVSFFNIHVKISFCIKDNSKFNGELNVK